MNPFEHDQHVTYDRLRSDILAWTGTKQVIMIASAVHGEGTTTVTSRLAATMARNTIGNVLAVDLNFGQPHLHETFRVENTAGLMDVLRGHTELSDVLQQTRLPNLKVLTAGGKVLEIARHQEVAEDQKRIGTPEPIKTHFDVPHSPPTVKHRPGEAPNLTAIAPALQPDVLGCHPSFATMREGFDFTLLDAPPITLHPESASLARWTDGVILVVQAGKTRWEVIQQAQAQLQMAGAKILGVVLNRRKFVIPRFLYDWI